MNPARIDDPIQCQEITPSEVPGEVYKPGEVAAIASAYALATIPINISPLIVGAIMVGFGIGEATAGAFTTVELVVMSATAFLLAPLGPRLATRRFFILAVALAIAAHGFTLLTNAPANYVPIRMVAGLAAGLLLLCLNTRVAHSTNPVRLYGIATLTTTIVGMVLLMVLPALISRFGYQALFGALLCLGLLVFPIQWLAPGSDLARETSETGQKRLSFRLVGLIAIALFFIQVSQGGYYAFVERMATGHALSPESIGVLLSVAYLAGVPGSALATWLGERWGQFLPIAIGLFAHSLAIGLACYTDNVTLFYTAVILQTFAYFFSIPYQLGLAAHLDPSGRLASIAAGIFFLGLSCGPVFGGWLVEAWHYQAIALSVWATVIPGLGIYAYLIRDARVGHRP